MSREPKTEEETMEAIVLVNPNYKSFADEYRRVKLEYKSFNSIENAWDRIYYFMPQIFSKAFELSDDKNSFEDNFQNIISRLYYERKYTKCHYSAIIEKMQNNTDECDEHIQDYKEFGYDDDIDSDLPSSNELYELISKLCNDREIKVLNMIYNYDMTTSQVADFFEVSPTRVTQIKAKAFRKIRREITIHKIRYRSSSNNISSSGRRFSKIKLQQIAQNLENLKLENSIMKELGVEYTEDRVKNDIRFQFNLKPDDIRSLIFGLASIGKPDSPSLLSMRYKLSILDDMSEDQNVKRIIEEHLHKATFLGIIKAVDELFDALNNGVAVYNYLLDKSNRVKVAYMYEYFHALLLENNIGVAYDKYMIAKILMIEDRKIRYYLYSNINDESAAFCYNLYLLYKQVESNPDKYSRNDRLIIQLLMKQLKMIN
jgi:hypothetical protein